MLYKFLIILICCIIIIKILLINNNTNNIIITKFNKYRSYKTNINVISYNTNNMPYYSKDIDAVLDIIKNNDIIFLQEMFSNIYSKDKYNILKEYCYKNNYNVITSDKIKLFSNKFLDGGLMIITKFPIYSYGFTNVCSNNIDVLSDKGILYCETKINNKKLLLFTTHLQTNYIDSKISDCQEKQLQNILKYIEKIKKLRNINRVLIGGDFNCDIVFKENLNKINYIFKNYNKHFSSLPTCDKENIDYFISNSGIIRNINIDNNNNYSDHKPISCEYYI